jgi:hypothetical protein
MPEASAVTVAPAIPGVLNWRKLEIVCPCVGQVAIPSPIAISVNASPLVFMLCLILLQRQPPLESATIYGLLCNL